MKKEKKLKRVSDAELRLIEAIRMYGEAYIVDVLKSVQTKDKTGVITSLVHALIPFKFYTLDNLVKEGAVAQNDADDARSALNEGRSVVVTGDSNSVLLVQALLWESVRLGKGRVVTLEVEPSIDLRAVDMNEDTEGHLVPHLSYVQFTEILSTQWGYVGLGAVDNQTMLSALDGVFMASKSSIFSVPCTSSEGLEDYLVEISGHSFPIQDTEAWKNLVVFETRLNGIEVNFSLERY